MNDLIKPIIGKWASPKEFDEEKQIKIANFEVLTLAEVTARDGRAPKYPPFDGSVRRLTFEQNGFQGQRILDVNSPSFQNDLSGQGIEIGVVGFLKRTPKGDVKGYK